MVPPARSSLSGVQARGRSRRSPVQAEALTVSRPAPLLGFMCRSTFYMRKPCAAFASTLPACRPRLAQAPHRVSEDALRLASTRLQRRVPQGRSPKLSFAFSPTSGCFCLRRPPDLFRSRFIRPSTSRPLQSSPTSSRPIPLDASSSTRRPHSKRPAEPRAPRKVFEPLLRQSSESGSHEACDASPPSAHDLSQAFDGLLLAAPCGLVSCRRHPWGSPPSRSSPPRGAAPPLGDPCPLAVDRSSSPVRLRRSACERARPPGPAFRALLPPRSPLLLPAV